ncbi:MAG: NIPSNAP family containing protein [Cyclobacteriaceae bacterium]|nr:NIPSNAP family containing protein [Cyclobacteriaceae bacterium]
MKRMRFNFLCGIIMSVCCLATLELYAQNQKKEFYEIKVYHLKNKSQEDRVDEYLKNLFIPAMHKAGIKNVGVFKPIATDTAFGKRIYVLTAYSSPERFVEVSDGLVSNLSSEKSEYLDAAYTDAPYQRIESILLRAFPLMLQMETPKITSARGDRIYELRSYESATESIYRSKVRMFNDGDEVGLFKRLGFNAVFYADVISGSRMPNLMYMTTFVNRTARDEKWKLFVEDPHWKRLVSMPEYQHNISKMSIYLLTPTEYSDY